MIDRPSPPAPRLRDRVLRATRLLTTPLLPDDYLGMLNPLWSARELRGRVVARRPVGPSTTELTIRPGFGWAGHRPGQHVGVGVELAGRWHWRTYSLTGAPDADTLTISVTAVPDGSVSSHLARVAREGDVLRLGPAAGDFTAPVGGPLLMVSGGSGVTPLLGMLRGLAGHPESARDVVLVHSGRGTPVHAEDLRELADRHPWLTLHEHDSTAGHFRPETLDVLVPDWRERTALVCGPGGMIDDLLAHHEAAGVPVRHERFRPPTPTTVGTGGTVTFTRSGITADADPVTPLLVAGEQAGALLPSGCRMGICHTCVGRLSAGVVLDLHTGECHEGGSEGLGDTIQTCVSAAVGDVEIDL